MQPEAPQTDQAPQMPTLDSAQSQSMPPAPEPSPNSSKKKLYIAIVVLVILLLAAGVYILMGNSKGSRQSANQVDMATEAEEIEEQGLDEETVAACADSLTEFKSDNLGIQFCYPSSWGTSEANTPEQGVSGSRYLISFANKPRAHVLLVSSDWEPEGGRGGACFDGVNATPNYSFTTDWHGDGTSEGYQEGASRTVASETDKYIIYENASMFLGGVCLNGVTELSDSRYKVATTSYFAGFPEDGNSSRVNDHVSAPNNIIPAADRQAFLELVKSIH